MKPWFCKCGKMNSALSTKCERCSLARHLGERQEKDLSSVVKPPPK